MARNASRFQALGKSDWTWPAPLNPIPAPALPLKAREVSDGDLEKKGADGNLRKWVAGASPR
jgi:hypothetical protein